MPRQTIRTLADEIRCRWPALLVTVEKSHANTDRKIGRGLRRAGKGLDGTRIVVKDPSQLEPNQWNGKPTQWPRILLDHDNAETYRRTDDVRRWIDQRIEAEKREHKKARRT